MTLRLDIFSILIKKYIHFMKFMKYSSKFTIILYLCHHYCHASLMEHPSYKYMLCLVKECIVYYHFIYAISQRIIHIRFCIYYRGWGGLCSILSVTAKFGIFLFYMIIAFKKIWVEFPDMVIFFCTGPNPRWPTAAILEKTKMDRIMSDTIFLRFLGSVNMILALF